MKLKMYVATAMACIAMTSCSEDGNTTSDLTTSRDVLEFASESDAHEMAAKIEEFRQIQELDLLKAFSLKYGITTPTESDAHSIPEREDPVIEVDLSEALQFYHKKRLESVYVLRKRFGFTSIQSIADEINSLQAIDARKAQELYAKHSDLLTRHDDLASPVFDAMTANLANTEGKLLIGGEMITAKSAKVTAREFTSALNLLGSTSAYQAKIYYTYQVGSTYLEYYPVWGYRTYFYTRMYCQVYYPQTGQYILYPCHFFTASNSYARFYTTPPPNFQPNFIMGFPNGYNSSLSASASVLNSGNGDYINATGYVSGTFLMPLPNGTFHNIPPNGMQNF